MEAVLVGLVCFFGLLVGLFIGSLCEDEFCKGRKQLSVALFLIVVISLFFHAYQQFSYGLLLLSAIILLLFRDTALMFFIGGLMLIVTPSLFLTGSSFFLYAFIAGLLHADQELKDVLVKHAGIAVVLLSFII